MGTSFFIYISICFALFLLFLFFKAVLAVPFRNYNKGLLRVLFSLSWLSWMAMLILVLFIGMLWPAPFSEGEPPQEDWCYYQTLGHDGKTVYELEAYAQKRVDLVLSDLISGKEQKRIRIITGESASSMPANMAWSGTALAFLIEDIGGSTLTAIKGDSVLFRHDVSDDEWHDKSVSWDNAKNQWLITSHFNDSSNRSYLKVKRYDEHFAVLHSTDTLQSNDTIHGPHFFFMNGSWWGVENLGWGGTDLYKASGNDSAILRFELVSAGEGDTAWWVPGVPWSFRNEKAKYLASAFGIQKIRRPPDLDSSFRLYVSPYAEMQRDTTIFRFPWSNEDNDILNPSRLMNIRFDTLEVTMRQRRHHYSLLHGSVDREISWYGKDDSLLQSVFLTGRCNGFFLKGDTLVVQGYGQGRRALFRVSTGKRLDHPGVIATYRWYLEDPEKSNWALLLPLLVLLAMPAWQLWQRRMKGKSSEQRMSVQLYFALIYISLGAAAWYILLDRAYS